MHVAMAVPWAPWSPTGGTERHVHELTCALVRQGVEATAVTALPVPPLPTGLPYPSIVLRDRLLFDLRRVSWKVRPGRTTWRQLYDKRFNALAEKTALDLKADVLHRHFTYTTSFRPRLPLVLTVHNGYLPQDEVDEAPPTEGRTRSSLLRSVGAWDRRRRTRAAVVGLEGVDEVICVSEHVQRRFLGRIGVDRPAHVIANGCPYPVPAWSKAEARRLLGLGDERVVLFVGHLWGFKRIDRLLPVLDDPGTVLVLLGKGPKEAEFAELARSQPRLRLLGYVDEETKRMWLRAADVLALLSGNFEGNPIVMMEALRSGTPVVGSHAEWLPPDLRPYGRFGEDVRRLVAEAAGLEADSAMAKVPDWDAVARQTIRVYEGALAGHEPRGRPVIATGVGTGSGG